MYGSRGPRGPTELGALRYLTPVRVDTSGTAVMYRHC